MTNDARPEVAPQDGMPVAKALPLTRLRLRLALGAAGVGFGLLLTTAFYLAPPPFVGVDWLQYHATALRLWQGLPIYGTVVGANTLYYNAPWLVVLLSPLALLPFRLGYALICVLNLALLGLLAQRFRFSPAQLAMLIVCPPVVYTLLHGQVDVVIVALCLLLPAQWSPLLALAKPQAAIALAFQALRVWRRAVLLTLVGLAVSFLVWGNWPLAVLQLPRPFIAISANVWLDFSPSQLILAALFLYPGLVQRDPIYLLAASPFLSPYAETYSFVGPALAALIKLPRRQAAFLFIVWWGVILFRWFSLGHE